MVRPAAAATKGRTSVVSANRPATSSSTPQADERPPAQRARERRAMTAPEARHDATKTASGRARAGVIPHSWFRLVPEPLGDEP